MNNREDEFRRRLLATFITEATEHLGNISSGLLAIEKAQPGEGRAKTIETVYRDVHSLKGASRAVNARVVEILCQALEGVFSLWKRGESIQTPEVFDAVYRAVTAMRSAISAMERGEGGADTGKISAVIKELSRFGAPAERGAALPKAAGGGGEKEPLQTGQALSGARTPASPTVRVSVERLNKLLLHSEDMLTAKYAADWHHAGLTEVAGMTARLRAELSRTYLGLMPSFEKAAPAASSAPGGTAMEEFCIWASAHLRELGAKVQALQKSSALNRKNIDRMVLGLIDEMKQAMMLPLSTVLEGFPIFVRDMARAQGKSVELTVRGGSIEIDRRILEEIKDPLIHIIRNCVDHGIESAAMRAALGKPPFGAITIAAGQTAGGVMEITISDDGAGINAEKVRQAAIASGAFGREDAEALSDSDALQLIFASGISTSPMITDISGRGLGLAIAREKAEKLGGALTVESAPKKGTVFRFSLPLTVATFRGIFIKAGGMTFIIPTSSVERTLRLKADSVKTVENREAVEIDGRPVSLARLDAVLGLPPKAMAKDTAAGNYVSAIVLNSGGRRIALGVDAVAGEDEVLVKPLGKQLQRIKNITGAAVAGGGAPVPVLNAQEIIRSATKTAPPLQALQTEEAKPGKILVVEDSVTARILLKNILEASGYSVKTAVDGVEALAALKAGEFDIVVADIEMPRMNGFDLTRKIRGDKKIADMPVVLVTALETKKDKEEGIEAGANAYIVKSSFDQGNLLAVVRQLI